MRALVTGATGLIGRQLVSILNKPKVLSRDSKSAQKFLPTGTEIFTWEFPSEEPPPTEAFEGVDVIFHLAGDPIAKGRWTTKKKIRLQNSRIAATRNLVNTLEKLETRPKTLVAASAIGFYGDRQNEMLTEDSPQGDGFLATLCEQWERETLRAQDLGIRTVCARIGVVLALEGGALEKMLLPFKLGLGGRLGNGQQWFSWIHIDDVVGLLRHAANSDDMEGPVNMVAPDPVTNRQFTRAMGRALWRPTLFPAPAFGLRLALGEMADALLLSSQRIHPTKAQDSEFSFQHPEINGALANLLGSPS